MASGISVKMAKAHLDLWYTAEEKVMAGQSYQIGTRSLTRADLSDILKAIDYWSDKLAEAEQAEAAASMGGGRNRVYRVVPRDL